MGKVALIPLGADDKDDDSSKDLPEEEASKEDIDAAQDVLDAMGVKGADVKTFAMALKNFIAGC